MFFLKIFIFSLKDIRKNPDFFASRKYLLSESTSLFLKQLGENIINGFLNELDCFLKPSTRMNYLFSFDSIMKFLNILKTEYPMIFELMGNIPIEIRPELLEFYQLQGFPKLREKATFNEYFFIVIVGFGFGVYNTYLIDKNTIKKLKLGFIRKNEKIYANETVYFNEIIVFLLENLKKMQGFNFKEHFSSGLILSNLSNFLLNVLNRFKQYEGFELIYEALLLEGFEVLSGFFRKADKENLIILQGLEIDAKISVLYKEHMKLLFSKKAKSLGLTHEMKAVSTKYYFQKHLNDLFEFPEKFKGKAFNSAKEKKSENLDFHVESCDLPEELKKWGIIFNIMNFLIKI